jgi:DNA-binding GntR family transcriptional regulator
MPTTFDDNTSAAARLSGARLSAVLYDTLKSRLLDGVYAAGDRIVVELSVDTNITASPMVLMR